MFPRSPTDPVSATSSPPPEWISQTGHQRVTVIGRLLNGGGDCTVMFTRDSDGWRLYPFGLDQGGVRLTAADVCKLVAQLSDQL